jgi:stearoyl-CoA desaturase (delta-9 desaturase)
MTFNFKIRLLQLINHVLAIIGIWLATLNGQLNLLWLSLLFYVLLSPIGIACGMHRLLSHGSYKTSRLWEIVLSILSIYATVGSTITWVALHRLHHVTAEKPNDPHSPYVGRGANEQLKFSYWQAFKSWVGFWNVVHISPRYAIKLIHDPFHAFIHKHYFKIIAITCVGLAVINPWLVLFVYLIPACLSLHATSVISVIAHIHGYKTHKINDESRNSWISSFVTLGDGWHNNHHANPSNWTTQEKWWEIDPCGWLIYLIKKS